MDNEIRDRTEKLTDLEGQYHRLWELRRKGNFGFIPWTQEQLDSQIAGLKEQIDLNREQRHLLIEREITEKRAVLKQLETSRADEQGLSPKALRQTISNLVEDIRALQRLEEWGTTVEC